MRENVDGVSVMQWLRSAYSREYQNLLERLQTRMGGLDPRNVADQVGGRGRRVWRAVLWG